MSTARSWFDRWIFDSFTVSAQGLALYRVVFALYLLLIIAPGHGSYANFSYLDSVPDIFFYPPPGPMQLFSGFPSFPFFEALLVLLNLSLVAVLVGYRTRWATLATGILLLVGYGFNYSLSNLHHNILLLVLPLVMAFSNWGAALSFDARSGRAPRQVHSWPLVMVALLLGYGMFTAGVPKIIGGWLDPSTHAVQGRFLREYFVIERHDLLAPLFIDVKNEVFWELLDVGTVLYEIGFLFAILHPFTTRLFSVFSIGFHTIVTLILNIAFLPNLVVYAAFVPWHRLAAVLPLPAPGEAGSRAARNSSVLSLLVLLGGTAFFYVVGSPLLWLNGTTGIGPWLEEIDVLAIIIANIVTIIAVGSYLWRRFGRPTSMARAQS